MHRYFREFLARINRNIVECKDSCHHSRHDLRDGINRNIVECKVYLRSILPVTAIVLIETLWNVKYKSVVALSAVTRINRNIVECKD